MLGERIRRDDGAGIGRERPAAATVNAVVNGTSGGKLPCHGLPDPHRSDPQYRTFYVVDITPTLFGKSALLREWGRRGSPGTLRLDSYTRHEGVQAGEQRTIKRRLQRGCHE